MPTLHWIGKDKVVNHHLDVPYRILNHKYTFGSKEQTTTESSVAESSESESENKIIHGDNLEALKSLLPKYEGRIKCIYIDPPYNTGNEGWVYNDNVNDPKINKWLGKVVGKESDDLTRHDKWLCMMYPRLALLHKLLETDGAIFISIDDNEHSNLKLVCDEIFGGNNFVTSLIWEKADSPRNSARQYSVDHDFVLVYSKRSTWIPNKLKRTAEANSIYKNPDNDPHGPWLPGDPYANKPYSKGLFTIIGPTGRSFSPPKGRYWRISEEKLQQFDLAGKIWWGPNGNARPSIKRYLNEVSDLVPRTLLMRNDVGSNRSSKNEMRSIFPETSSFDTPKPTRLIERILESGSDKNSIVLDSFAGSGTTAHAVLNLNKQDGGSRKFILVEMEDYAESITSERVKRVINGYGEGSNAVEGTGGSFAYYELGQPLFLENEMLNEEVSLEKIHEYVWYSETRQQYSSVYQNETYLLGCYNSTALYFYYNKNSVTTLDDSFLRSVKTQAGQYLIYADLCVLEPALMQKYHITFKKIPRDITRF